MHALTTRSSLRRIALGLAGLVALASTTTRADAQSIQARCSVAIAGGCTTLRLDVLAGAAPFSLLSLGVQLGAGWSFLGATPSFIGEDDFSFGMPFSGTATPTSASSLRVDFLASPGFSFELAPGSAGYLQFDVQGIGSAPIGITATDPDGATFDAAGVVDPSQATVTPEPATTTLLASGLLALVGAARARRRAAA